VRFGILGPLEAKDGDRVLNVGGQNSRSLLACLLVRANEVVPVDALIDAVWPRRRPADADNSLQTQVTRLRNVLEPDRARDRATAAGGRIARDGAGYVLRCADGELDALAFEAASRRGDEALAAGRNADAADAAAEALGWWRGDEALAGYAEHSFAAWRAAQLDERRLATIECGVEARLALGQHRELVAELTDLAERQPLRESLWGHLIVALYRSGRQADALRAYERVRVTLRQELGLNPRAELARLEERILAQDPALDWVPPAGNGAAPAATPSGTAAGPPGTPAGTLITFLFTDVEASTARWVRDPDAMASALRAHDSLVRGAIEHRGGVVFGHPGDGFCAAFDRVGDAVTAALDAQLGLAGAGWEGHDPLDVRMAIHTGNAELREGNYFGATVNRVARLRDAAHGGQILVSATARELVAEALPGGVDLIDLGNWVFEGFDRAERVHQLRHPMLPAGFPPLRSGRLHTGAVPRPVTSFVGRPRECERVAELLRAGCLVTITGEGGLGKTRLALEVARRAAVADYPDGIWFCDLSSVRDADSLAEQLAGSLRLATPGGADVRREVVASLAGARSLLIVDNCETVRPDVARLLGDALAAGTEAKIIATSRAPLRVLGEQVLPLDPLGLPGDARDEDGDDEDGGDDTAPAVQLLVDRARAAGAVVNPREPALGDIVYRLDGMPLAIELAAPRLATLSPGAVAARLDRLFDLLAPGPAGMPARHRTLRATVDWSFQMLGDEARTLFAALSVFRGGWTLELAERIAPAAGVDVAAVAPLLADLVDQSLVRIDLPADGSARYDMLGAMRVYARDYLVEIGQEAAVADRHADHFVELAEAAVPHRRGPLEVAWVSGLAAELANLRAAYEWLVASGRTRDALRLVAALVDDVLMRERLEIGRWAAALAADDATRDEPLRAVALALAGNTAMVESRLDDARSLSDAALAVGATPADGPWWIAHNTLALVSAVGQDTEAWNDHLAALEDHTRLTGDPMPAAIAEYDRALIASHSEEPAQGVAPAESLLALAAERANPSLRAMGLLAHARAVAGADAELAGAELHEALSTASSAHNTLLAQQALRALDELNARSGDPTAALASLRVVVRRFAESGNVGEQLQTVVSMLDSLVALGALEAAATVCGALSRSPLRDSASCRLIDRAVADRLDQDSYARARRKGAAMTPADLVTFTSATASGLSGDSRPG
jgi:predicted ATPase/DNA-binding SARP family transcriptional activator